jgi:hypothetical protein
MPVVGLRVWLSIYAAMEEVKAARKLEKEKTNRKNSKRLEHHADKLIWLPESMREARRVKATAIYRTRRRGGKTRKLLEIRAPQLVGRDLGVPWYTNSELLGANKRR